MTEQANNTSINTRFIQQAIDLTSSMSTAIESNKASANLEYSAQSQLIEIMSNIADHETLTGMFNASWKELDNDGAFVASHAQIVSNIRTKQTRYLKEVLAKERGCKTGEVKEESIPESRYEHTVFPDDISKGAPGRVEKANKLCLKRISTRAFAKVDIERHGSQKYELTAKNYNFFIQKYKAVDRIKESAEDKILNACRKVGVEETYLPIIKSIVDNKENIDLDILISDTQNRLDALKAVEQARQNALMFETAKPVIERIANKTATEGQALQESIRASINDGTIADHIEFVAEVQKATNGGKEVNQEWLRTSVEYSVEQYDVVND